MYVKPCTCVAVDLWNYGCKCGHLAALKNKDNSSSTSRNQKIVYVAVLYDFVPDVKDFFDKKTKLHKTCIINASRTEMEADHYRFIAVRIGDAIVGHYFDEYVFADQNLRLPPGYHDWYAKELKPRLWAGGKDNAP